MHHQQDQHQTNLPQQNNMNIQTKSIISSYFENISSDQNNAFNQEVFQQQPQPLFFDNNNSVQENYAQHTIPTQISAMAVPFQSTIDTNDVKIRELNESIGNQNHQIMQLKSEVEFHRATAMNLQQNADELNRLKQHDQQQHDVVKVLITEKSNLMDSLQKSEQSVSQLKNENEELHNRLNVSRNRLKQLEQTQSKQQTIQHQEIVDSKKLEEMVNERMKEFKALNQSIETEKNELKLLLDQQRIEMENLQRNFDHINTELHLASVKVEQLSDGTQEAPEVIHQSQMNSLSQDVAIRQQQINELNSIIDQLNNDRDASETQYQNYVSAITNEMQELKVNSNEMARENDKLAKREQELLKHVSDLERQMQQQMQKQRIYAEQNAQQEQSVTFAQSNEDIENMTSQISTLTANNESLKSQLNLLQNEKLEWTKTLCEKADEIQSFEFQLEKMRTITPNLTQLMTDFEDKSTAASRAMSQNQNLKEQLDELQRAFVNISNDKMELTDKLTSEVHLCKEMKSRYDSMETELTGIKEKWHYKEDEMIRLSKENTELEKKIMQQNIQIDRLRHYESKNYHSTDGILQKELEHCKHLIESLTNKINVLESQKVVKSQDHHDEHDHNHDGHSHSHDHKDDQCDDSKKHLLEEIEMLKMEKSELIKAINDFQMTKKPSELEKENAVVNGDTVEEMSEEKLQQMSTQKSVTASIATEEALEKLQGRFRRTMLEVAELTEEKLRLEHVVMQLQFETETIGEYITLYQNQRRQLKQKEHERDIQLRNLAHDREMMNKKLVQLNGLIEKFVLQHTDQVELAKEATKMLENDNQKENVVSEPYIVHPKNTNNSIDFEKLKKETAGKILEILSDIKTTNTKTYDSVGVENCACCFGELKTV